MKPFHSGAADRRMPMIKPYMGTLKSRVNFNTKFVREIISRYSDIELYDFDPASFVYLELEKEKEQEDLEKMITRLLLIFNQTSARELRFEQIRKQLEVMMVRLEHLNVEKVREYRTLSSQIQERSVYFTKFSKEALRHLWEIRKECVLESQKSYFKSQNTNLKTFDREKNQEHDVISEKMFAIDETDPVKKDNDRTLALTDESADSEMLLEIQTIAEHYLEQMIQNEKKNVKDNVRLTKWIEHTETSSEHESTAQVVEKETVRRELEEYFSDETFLIKEAQRLEQVLLEKEYLLRRLEYLNEKKTNQTDEKTLIRNSLAQPFFQLIHGIIQKRNKHSLVSMVKRQNMKVGEKTISVPAAEQNAQKNFMNDSRLKVQTETSELSAYEMMIPWREQIVWYLETLPEEKQEQFRIFISTWLEMQNREQQKIRERSLQELLEQVKISDWNHIFHEADERRTEEKTDTREIRETEQEKTQINFANHVISVFMESEKKENPALPESVQRLILKNDLLTALEQAKEIQQLEELEQVIKQNTELAAQGVEWGFGENSYQAQAFAERRVYLQEFIRNLEPEYWNLMLEEMERTYALQKSEVFIEKQIQQEKKSEKRLILSELSELEQMTEIRSLAEKQYEIEELIRSMTLAEWEILTEKLEEKHLEMINQREHTIVRQKQNLDAERPEQFFLSEPEFILTVKEHGLFEEQSPEEWNRRFLQMFQEMSRKQKETVLNEIEKLKSEIERITRERLLEQPEQEFKETLKKNLKKDFFKKSEQTELLKQIMESSSEKISEETRESMLKWIRKEWFIQKIETILNKIPGNEYGETEPLRVKKQIRYFADRLAEVRKEDWEQIFFGRRETDLRKKQAETREIWREFTDTFLGHRETDLRKKQVKTQENWNEFTDAFFELTETDYEVQKKTVLTFLEKFDGNEHLTKTVSDWIRRFKMQKSSSVIQKEENIREFVGELAGTLTETLSVEKIEEVFHTMTKTEWNRMLTDLEQNETVKKNKTVVSFLKETEVSRIQQKNILLSLMREQKNERAVTKLKELFFESPVLENLALSYGIKKEEENQNDLFRQPFSTKRFSQIVSIKEITRQLEKAALADRQMQTEQTGKRVHEIQEEIRQRTQLSYTEFDSVYEQASLVTVRPPVPRGTNPPVPELPDIKQEIREQVQEEAEDILFVRNHDIWNRTETRDRQFEELIEQLECQEKEMQQLKETQNLMLQSSSVQKIARQVLKQIKNQIRMDNLRNGRE